MAAMTLFHA